MGTEGFRRPVEKFAAEQAALRARVAPVYEALGRANYTVGGVLSRYVHDSFAAALADAFEREGLDVKALGSLPFANQQAVEEFKNDARIAMEPPQNEAAKGTRDAFISTLVAAVRASEPQERRAA